MPRLRGPFECRECGAEYHTRRPVGEGEKFCSRACAFAYENVHGRPARRKPVQLTLHMGCQCGAPLAKTSATGECGQCGYVRKRLTMAETRPAKQCTVCKANYLPEYGQYAVATCSAACADEQRRRWRRANKKRVGHNHRKRTRIKGGFVETFNVYAVFERDQWRCRACGCETPKSLRGTREDSAPELDHIVPISHGGGHTMENTQLLCRTCNCLKGARTMEQFVAQWVPRAMAETLSV